MVDLAQRLRLMLVTDDALASGRRSAANLCDTVAAALCGGVTAVQAREKSLGARELYDLCVRLRALTRQHGALLIINDRVDVAVAVEGDGVHLGWRSLSPAVARQAGGAKRLIIGRSCHSAPETLAALAEGCDYVTVGPVFETPSKRGLVEAIGMDALELCARQSAPAPVVAIGGLTAAHSAAIIKSGAAGMAVIRALMDAADPEQAARAFLTGQ